MNSLFSRGSQDSGLSNQFAIMRHGHSEANAAGIVVSDPLNGIKGYGLSTLGQQQVMEAVRKNNGLNQKTVIISSDFRRARETAEIVHRELGCQDSIQFDPRLRERFFGEFELMGNTIYEQVWQRDEIDAEQSEDQVESAKAVMTRGAECVMDLDQRYQGRMILLVSHGDTLQILQSAFAGQPANLHRQMPHLETAEARHLRLNI